jgi:hypothetical protein
MTVKSADDVIVQDEARKLGKEIPVIPTPVAATVEPEKAIEAPEPDVPEELPIAAKADPEAKPADATEAVEGETEDAYGNKVAPAKMYSEEEVQRMIRERLARGRQSQPEQTQVQEAAKDFKADPESEESWEAQLGNFVENKIAQIEEKKQQSLWKERENTTQQEFEEKFTTGMGKYGDFTNVVSGKPITSSMMMATRSMEDPAAFLYAACKQQPAEIERIAKMQDPYAQIAEMGRLEERMKKSRILTAAPKPAKRISGDTTTETPKYSIDQLIATHAKDKIMNMRR